MKPTSIKQLNEIIDRLSAINIDDRDYNFVKEKIANIIRVEMPTRNEKFNFYKFVSTDKIRPVMTGVYHDSGYKIASDSHILIALKEDYPIELEGQIMLKNGELLDKEGNKYPNWRKVIPEITDNNDSSKYILCDVKHDEWKEIYSRYKAEKKVGTQHNLVKLNVGFDCYFQVELFNLFMMALKEVGADLFYISSYEKFNYMDKINHTKTETDKIFYNSDNAKVLLCPCRASEDEQTYLLNIK